MKNFFSTLSILLITQITIAQNVGIGTTTPNAKAALEINSTNKGLLIPTMTTSQLYAISSPPNGLLVYNTSYGELYQYNGTAWKGILNSNYWTRPLASRNKITNNLDSVGIGTNSPSEWLDVDGNIRSRNNVMADNNVSAVGSISGATLFSSGNAAVGGTALLYGAVTAYNDIIMSGENTFQLRSAAVDKGFFQLAGDDFRIGINAANTSGRFAIRTGGANRLYVDAAGNVSINTPTVASGYKLTIKGKAICEELKVQLSGNWPDYVFERLRLKIP